MLPAKRPVCLVENLPRFSNLVNLYIPNPAKRIYNRNQISPKRISKRKKIRPKKVVLGNTAIKQNLLYYCRQARDVDPEPKRTQRRSRFFLVFSAARCSAENRFFTLPRSRQNKKNRFFTLDGSDKKDPGLFLSPFHLYNPRVCFWIFE